MPKRNADNEQLTHLGWQNPASAGQGDQDHLWLQDPWPGSSANGAQTQGSVIQFLDPALSSREEDSPRGAEAGNDGHAADGILFHEVSDSPVEAPAFLWSGTDTDANALAEPIVFGERADATVFS
ncbi:MAG: hypothetical protein EBZ51_11560 [Synechococcaceae bacterium WB9_2_112]|nr:hypothetical protein [Synechococcaceae bacterium WB9_2_112]